MIYVKDIIIKPIKPNIANVFIKKYHYSGKVVNNSQLHLGAFYNNILHGVLSFGCSLDKRKMLGLVKGTLWNEFLELNRLAFDDILPKNSESRSLSICFKMIKKQYPHIKWILSFADGTQCGDGTIYRASGFVLTKIKVNEDLILREGKITHTLSVKTGINKLKLYTESKGASRVSGVPLKGFQLRYIYFLHKEEIKNLTVPLIPFSEIEKRGAKMYLGKSLCGGSSKREQLISNEKVGGVLPTPPLHLIKECNGI